MIDKTSCHDSCLAKNLCRSIGLNSSPKTHRPTTAITYPRHAAWLAPDFDWQTVPVTCWPTCFRLEVGIPPACTSHSLMAAFDFSVPTLTPRSWDRSPIAVTREVVALEQ